MTFLQRKLKRITGNLANVRAQIQKNLATISKLQNENSRLEAEYARLDRGWNRCNVALASEEEDKRRKAPGAYIASYKPSVSTDKLF